MVMIMMMMTMMMIGSLSDYEDDENVKKKTIVFITEKNNYCARALRFLVHFFDARCTTTT